MSQTAICPEGGSITCSILQVAQRLSDGPTDFDILVLLVIPLIAALATLAAVGVSVWVAYRANTKADASEFARVNAESARIENDRIQRFKESLGAFLVEVPEHVAALLKHDRDLMEYPTLVRLGKASSVLPPIKPSNATLMTKIATAELNAIEGEIPFLEALKVVVGRVSSNDAPMKAQSLRFLPSLIVDWMKGSELARSRVMQTLGLFAISTSAMDIDQFVAEYQELKNTGGSDVQPRHEQFNAS